jgi:hypothetical protein
MRGISMLAIAALIALGGCGGGGDKKSSGDSSKAQTSAGPQATATSPAGKTTEAPQKALAASDGTIDSKAVRMEIVELKRSGASTVLNLRLTTKGTGLGAQVNSTFDDGLFQKLKSSDNPTNGGDTMDGISLVDSKNRKRYLVGRDSDNACVCDSGLGSAFVTSDSPLLLSATFGAPPGDVTAVDVVVPRFGTFKDVPLS